MAFKACVNSSYMDAIGMEISSQRVTFDGTDFLYNSTDVLRIGASITLHLNSILVLFWTRDTVYPCANNLTQNIT